MTNQPTGFDLRPMTVGEILDQTFRVYRRAWKPLLVLSCIYAVPISALNLLSQGAVLPTADQNNLMLRVTAMIQRGRS